MKQVFVKGEQSKITIDTSEDELIATLDSQMVQTPNQKYVTSYFKHRCNNGQPFFYTYNRNVVSCGDVLNENLYEINITSLLTILLQDALKEHPVLKLTEEGKKLISKVKEQ